MNVLKSRKMFCSYSSASARRLTELFRSTEAARRRLPCSPPVHDDVGDLIALEKLQPREGYKALYGS